MQLSLQNLSEDAKLRAQSFVKKSKQLWGVVYDNINFTLRKNSQRLDPTTQQINATTLAVFSLPAKFTRDAYAMALSISERNKWAGFRQLLDIDLLQPNKEKNGQITTAFQHAIRTILLTNCPRKIRQQKPAKLLRRHTLKLKPKIRWLSRKNPFFPLPALNEEEASVSGTIRVVEKIFTILLGLAMEIIEVELQLLVGDWRGLYTAQQDLTDSIGFHRSLLESTRLVTQTFSVSHRPNWQVQSGVVCRNMPCSGRLPGFGLDFSANQVHWTPLDWVDSTGFQQLHWTPADSAGFHGLQWILLDSGGLCMTSLFNY